MRKALTVLAFSLGALWARPAAATTCSIPYSFTNGTPAQAAQVNSNFSSLQSCGNNIDYNNIGTSGIYASQMIPGNSAQATFGGSQTYTVPAGFQVNGVQGASAISTAEADGQWVLDFPSDAGMARTAIGVNTGNGYYYYALAKLDTGHNFQAWLMGVDASGNLIIPNGGVQAQGAITAPSATISGVVKNVNGTFQQTTSSTTYTFPYDANSTSGSSNTHIEHGSFNVNGNGAGFVCGSLVTFLKSFSASPDISVSVIAGGTSLNIISANGISPFISTRSSSGFTACAFANGATFTNTTFTISWKASGE